MPPNMQGLTEEQIVDLKLKDEFEEVCIPSGGFVMNPDPTGRRNGRGKSRVECRPLPRPVLSGNLV